VRNGTPAESTPQVPVIPQH